MVTDKGLDEYFVFYGRKPVKDMPIYYQIADVCLLTLKGDSNVGMTIPSKLQGYMAAGKPVLAAINGSAKEIIKDSECGISVEAGDYRALAMAMVKMIDEKEKLVSYGKNGRELFFKKFYKRKIYK